MVSINSSAAYAGIRLLQSINKDLAVTQNRLSTGNKINSAADGASLWKAAQTLRADVKTGEAVATQNRSVKAAFEVAAAGADQIVELLNTMKSKVAYAATASGTDLTNVEAEISAIQSQLTALTVTAQVSGNNLLDGTGTGNKYITSVSPAGVVTTVTVATRDVKLTDLGTAVTGVTAGAAAANRYITTFDTSDLVAVTGDAADMIAGIQAAIDNIGSYSASLSAAAESISTIETLTSKLNDIKDTAISDIVSADPAEELVKLQALQVKQQMTIQAISIANSSSQNILALFR